MIDEILQTKLRGTGMRRKGENEVEWDESVTACRSQRVSQPLARTVRSAQGNTQNNAKKEKYSKTTP